MLIKPRPYQIKAVESTLDILFNQEGKNPIVAMPTGTGKSDVIGWTMRAVLQRVPHARLMNCAHVKELISQNSSELSRIWPAAPYGIYSAGLNEKQAAMPITFASIQSAVKNLPAFGKQAALFVDEAHLVAPEAETNYQKLIKAFRERNPTMPVIGYTATQYRMKQGLLTDGNIFDCVAFDNTQKEDFVQLIDDGYLSQLIPKRTSFAFDVSGVKKIGGEFNAKDLQEAVNIDTLSEQALQESLQCAHDRNHWLIYCSGIEHVENVVSMLQLWGEKALAVHSKMSTGQRDAAITAFKTGECRMLISEGILTTGFNSPWVDCIVLLRPTMSPGLHVQILGRGTRPFYATGYTWEMLEDRQMRLDAIAASSKQNCLVLDFAGNTMRLGPINDPRVPKAKGKGTGDAPVKICPCCDSFVHAAQRFCDGAHWERCPCGEREGGRDDPYCRYEFQFETKLEQTAATVELIARDAPQMDWFKVSRVEYELHTKPFTPPMMRVKYYCGLRRFTEYVCIEHQNYAGKEARNWWKKRLPNYPPPPTTDMGFTALDLLKVPTWIFVHHNRKYPTIKSVSFEPAATPPETFKAKEYVHGAAA